MRKIYYLPLSLFILFACSGGETKTEINASDANVAVPERTFKVESNTSFKLPSPVELYLLIKDEGATFRQDELHDIELNGDYVTSVKKAVNFGIYASDLAYCTVFEKQQETHSYFKGLKSMASDLGIDKGYDETIVARLDDNLYNSDSLYQITGDSYWEVCTYLEENNKSAMLVQILTGGWTESVFLSISSVEKFTPENRIIMRIAEQSYLLENLIDYLSTLDKDAETEEYFRQLTDLQYSFDKLIDNPEDVIITKEQYKEIVGKVKALRADLVK